MVNFETPTGDIEVRLRKGLNDNTPPVYFDEYAPLGKLDTSKDTITRYIVPEATSYSIEVVFKKGFNHENFSHLHVGIKDLESGARLLSKWIDFSLRGTQDDEKTFQVKHLPTAIIDGEIRRDVELSFRALSPDENLLEPACDATYGTESLAGIEIRVSRYSNYEEMRKSPTTIQKEMKSHRQRMKLKEDTLKTTSNISEVLFVKSGITHGSRLVGGRPHTHLIEPSTTYIRADQKINRKYRFFFRSKAFLEKSNFMRSPILNEYRPWSLLEGLERELAFGSLLDYDQKKILEKTMVDRGPNATEELIRRELFETGILPSYWRSWKDLTNREQEMVFSMLQDRRKFFDRGEYPPEAGEPKGAAEVSQAKQSPVKVEPGSADATVGQPGTARTNVAELVAIDHVFAAPLNQNVGSEPIVQTNMRIELGAADPIVAEPVDAPHIDATALNRTSGSEPMAQSNIKVELQQAPSTPKARSAQPDIIVINDTPPRHDERSAPAVLTKTKNEESDNSNLYPVPRAKRSSAHPAPPSKKVKIEEEENIIILSDDDEAATAEDEELNRMEEELLAAQRVRLAAQKESDLLVALNSSKRARAVRSNNSTAKRD